MENKMAKQMQLEEQVLRLGAEDFGKLCELEREVNGYFEKNFSGFTIYVSLNNLVIEYGGLV
ncbi:Uncharacterised protein [uncultured archaeon]|nr:Uncharacterised protein [uncultured archaeon]